ncbi:UNC93-like protein MFSD11 [Dreissena polymorpha]|uniref:UNC93-like protein MFSD11 n=1 Tax=Dreissena polymorpha TaxID=45954 RepID=UPI002264A1FC|nr:UNC93-like protein MFSD11 [Dreissena polymorpha]XP_052262605.1 UNC93-like protein MFSD11 [Dreissena polymorpha]
MAGEVFDIRLCNVIVLGVSFMLIFTAFQTASMAEESVLNSADSNSNGSSNGTSTFDGAGYKSLSVIYIVFAVSNWVAPSIVVVIGAKLSMFFGSLLYLLFIVSFLKPMLWSLYTGSVLVGFGAAVLWTGQGNFLTTNSDSETISRNSGIFWALLQFSLLFGNAYSYFVLKGAQVISTDERTKLFIGLSGAGLLGSLCLLFLRKRHSSDNINLNSSGQVIADTPLSVLKRSFHLIRTKEMLLLSITIFYTGIELTFFSGVYGTCLSNNLHFGKEAKGLIGISGMFIGVGEILGGSLFGLMGKSTNRHGRDLIIMFGYVVHMVCFFLIFINLPERSPINESNEATYITSSKYVAILCSFLLGLGDSSFNTQIYSLLGFMFPEDSSPAFAIFKFVQSISAAIAFFYSDYLILQYQLLIMVILGTFGCFSFSLVEWKSTKINTEGYQSI